ncbi:MAG: glutamate--tRNA ligase, partial [Clostridiaceae bacterium]|nr:glutamate--tRNA ligase [Clostridiaceae bacterium]
SPALFDYDKLAWFNAGYLRAMESARFLETAAAPIDQALGGRCLDRTLLASILQPRVERLTDIPGMIGFLAALPDYDTDLFTHKKMKTDPALALTVLTEALETLSSLPEWGVEPIHAALIGLAESSGRKNGQVMWPVRIAASGTAVTPGGAVEILSLLGREESLGRIRAGVDKLRPLIQG